jgi:type I restriction enzyme M protein
MIFKKCREQDDNILFIDASREFEKVKTQNYLTDEHVQKIVDTYAKRKTMDKYAYVADLEEVAENDYSLNIPRYVDTFEEEEPIDLDEVSDQLRSIDADIKATDDAIADYCKELGIKTPF